jgi:hypothetical protein
MNDNTQPKTSLEPTPDYFTLAHIAGVLTAVVAYIVIFSITGDADLFWAFTSGMSVWLIIWLFAPIHWGGK